MTKMLIRDVSLNVKIMGHGSPLVLMHGGPGADLYSLMSLKPLKDQFTLVFYDHRCNGRSTGADVSTLTWDNLTADVDALREKLGFDRWAVLGHSFGGYVAMEYALRYPERVSRLVLMNTGADHRWAQERVTETLTKRGFSPETVALAHRFLNGQIEPGEMFSDLMKLGDAYTYHLNLKETPHMILDGMRSKLRPEALIYSAAHLLKGYSLLERLHEITIPALIVAGRQDFIYPPEAQNELAAGLPNSRLVFVDRASHNPHEEHPAEVIQVVRDFLSTAPVGQD
jgi:proline-specific peptidase